VAIEGIARDITERKLMESEILSLNRVLEQKVAERTKELEKANVLLREEVAERKKAEEILRKALEERTVLLRELYHRVKNNMQVIISLISLQARKIDDPRLKQMMEETQNRIRAMALVHERLYKSENLSEIDLGDYIPLLVTQIFSSHLPGSRKVKKVLEIDHAMVTIEIAVPIGLIVTELVSNTFKHAFPGEMTGTLSVFLRKKDKTITLTVSDDGVGMPENSDWRNLPTLGLHLVQSLVEQLQGTIDFHGDHGTTFTIRFGVGK
jgi:two-component sensor histidine kinase